MQTLILNPPDQITFYIDFQLEDLFSEFGSVISANVITDRDTKRSRGFGFVELESGGPEAIEAMNDSDLEGRKLTVNEAKPRT